MTIALEASTCLKNLDYRDLALPAARIALSGAVDADDPTWTGATRYACTLAMPVEAAGTTSRVADRAVGELQGVAAQPDARQVLGQLHLSAALACAVDKRPDEALAHLRAAEDEARTLGDPPDGIGFNLHGFGPTNVALQRVAVANELGDHGNAAELAAKASPAPLRMATRHFAYWLDRGRALAHSGRTDGEALAAFMLAERAAPLLFSINALARDAVTTMVYRARRRAVPVELHTLARRLGIEVKA